MRMGRNEVVVLLDGLDMFGGVVTSWVEAGDGWFDGEWTTKDSPVSYAFRQAVIRLLYRCKADSTPGHLSAASATPSRATWR